MPNHVEWIRLSWDVLWSLGTAAAIALAWWTKRTTAQRKEMDEVRRRIELLQAERKHQISHGDLGKIYGALDALGRELAEMKGASQATQRTVEQMNRYLIEVDK
jgi:hypothetical protein